MGGRTSPESAGGRARLRIERMGRNGEGVAALPSGQVVFVAGGLPGETVQAEITDVRSRYARARATAVVEPAPERVVPPCPVYAACGGCVFQHWRYEAELAYKRERVRQALERIGGLPGVEVEPVRGASSPYGYRAKGSFPWGGVPGHLTLGLYRRGTHDVVPVERCAIQDPVINRVLAAAPAIADGLRLEPYDEKTGSGLLRHLVVRTSRRERRAVALVVARGADPRLIAFARSLMRQVDALKGVAANFNPSPGNRILGDDTVVLAGDPWLQEDILGARFRLGADTFFQVHPEQVAVLYGMVLTAVPAVAEAWDLYAGVGTLAVLLARRAARVRAVEVSPAAVALGRLNARDNGVQVRFYQGAAEDVVPRLAEEGARPDVAVLDPPRSGLRPPVIEALKRLRPERIVYVSCEPESLARDVAAFHEDYRVGRVAPVDLFPRTDHVETVLIMDAR
jgi:23S rRNA (uracil1939-C5)-methyltransferase